MNSKIRGKNPIWIIIAALMPWRYKNTYIVLHESSISLSHYLSNSQSNVFHREVDTFKISDIVSIENATHRYSSTHEVAKVGMYGEYKSQEIRFILKNQIQTLNCRPYTKEQINHLLEYIFKSNPRLKSVQID